MMRLLGPADSQQAIGLISQFFEHHSSCTSTSRVVAQDEACEIWEEWLNGGLLFGLDEGGQLLGLLRFRQDCDVYWIEDMVVDERRRGMGIGGRVLEWAEEWAQSRGARSLFLDVVPANLGALDFVLDHGYEYLNTIELRKNFHETPPKAEIALLGRRFKIHSWPAEKPLPH